MKSKCIIVFAVLLALLIRAKTEETSRMTQIDQNGPLLAITNRKVNYSEILDLSTNNPLFEEFCTTLDIEYYKSAYGIKYTTLNTDNGPVLAIFSDSDRLIYIKLIRYSYDNNEEKLSGVNIGISLTDIMKIDPEGDYSFLLASWSGYPQFSFHYFLNGDCYIFHYENGILDKVVFITL